MIVPAVTPEAREMLIGYLCAKLNTTPDRLVGQMPYEVVAVLRNDRHKGAVLYSNYRKTSIEICWAGEPGWITRADLRGIFSYAFNQLGVYRIDGLIERGNSISRNLAMRLGCREAGILESEFGKGRDAILYTMRRDKCRWIDPKKNTE